MLGLPQTAQPCKNIIIRLSTPYRNIRKCAKITEVVKPATKMGRTSYSCWAAFKQKSERNQYKACIFGGMYKDF